MYRELQEKLQLLINEHGLSRVLVAISKCDVTLRHEDDPIEKLNLNVRTFNALYRADIHTVRQAIEFFESYPRTRIRNFGDFMHKELDQKLHERGYLKR